MIFRLSSPFRAAVAAFRSAWAYLRGYAALVDTDDWEARKAICEACEFRDGEQCRVCGCFISAKTILAAEQCPKKKWRRIKKVAKRA